jgi:excinuclease ABC subunit A
MDAYHIPYDVPWQGSFATISVTSLLYGSDKDINHVLTSSSGNQTHKWGRIEGVKTMIERRYSETTEQMDDAVLRIVHARRYLPDLPWGPP